MQINGACCGQAQTPVVEAQAAVVRPGPAAEGEHAERGGGRQPPPVTYHEMTGAHQAAGNGRQLPFFIELLEDRLEARHEADHEHDQHNDADDRQEDGIGQGADHLGLKVFLMLGEVGDAAQHVFQKAAFLPRSHHADGQLVERPGMLSHGLGQARAVSDAGADLADDLAEGGLRALPLENIEAAQKRHAGAQQVGELRVKRGHVARPDPPAPAMARGALGRSDGHGKEPAGIEHGHDFALAGRGQCPLVALPVVRQGLVREFRHSRLQI